MLEVNEATDDLIATGRWMAARDLVPATSGNLSCRLPGSRIAITASGCDKGALQREDILIVDLDGETEPRASAESPLHLALYRARMDVGAVLHGHSRMSTLLSARALSTGRVWLRGYELVKAFRGITTHETAVEVPVFENTQDMALLAARVGDCLPSMVAPCYLVAGHGFYAWGRTLVEARRHVEALEFLLGCEWERTKDRS
jgi:methylthioribulose-1-phosphate dehydratase